MFRDAKPGRLPATLVATFLAACGGGGGGGGGTAATPPAPVAPTAGPTVALALTTDNAESVATLSFKLLAGPLRIVQVARNVLPATLASGAPTVYTFACPTRGAVDVDFTDADNSRSVTPGDALRLDFRDCDAITPTLTARGELRLAIGATPPGLAADATGYSLTATAPTGLRLTSPDQPALEYTGSFQATVIESPAQIVWDAIAGTSGELLARSIDTSSGKQTTETLVGFSARRVVDYDQARITSQFAATLRSEALQGQVVIRTPAPLVSDLNTYPDAGRLEIDGSGSGRITIASNLELNSESASLSLDANGDGTLELRDRLTAWTRFNDGQLWIEPRYDAGRLNLQTYRVVRAAGYLGNRSGSGEVSVLPVVELQFSRRIASVANLGYVFRQGTVLNATADDIPAVPDVHGARLLLRPATQLVHGKPYSIVPAGTFVDEGGLTVRPPTLAVQTRNNLVARITAPRVVVHPGLPFTLDGTGSVSTDGPVRAWRWRQISGSPASLQGVTTSQATVAPAAPAQPAAERLRFELAVENAAGEVATASVPVEIVAAGNDQTIIGVVRFAPASTPSGTITVALSGGVGAAWDSTWNPNVGFTCCYAGVFQPAFTQPGDGFPNPYSEFMFRGLSTTLGLVPGTYTMAGPQPSWAHQLLYGTGPAIAILFPEINATSCPWILPPATFTILESQQAPDGRPLKLAVDFSYRCGASGELAATGALRYRSGWPLPSTVLGP